MDELLEECGGLGSIGSVATALVQYATSLGATNYEKKGNRFVPEPNFVTFEVHRVRTKNLTISLRGYPKEFQTFSELSLKRSQNGYSEVKVTAARQLHAAAAHIARAREVFDRGRERTPKSISVVEG